MLSDLVNESLQKWGTTPPERGMGVIYVGRNTQNGKMYVGLHGAGRGKVIQSVKTSRWNKHSSKSNRCTALANSMKIHGNDVFEWYVLEYVDEQALNDREVYWIKELNTIAPNGYNLLSGGDRPVHCDETIARMKEARNKPEYVDGLKKRRRGQWAGNHEKFTNALRASANTETGKKRMSANASKLWDRMTYDERSKWVIRIHQVSVDKKRLELLAACNTEEDKKKREDRLEHHRLYKQRYRKIKSGELVPTKRGAGK